MPTRRTTSIRTRRRLSAETLEGRLLLTASGDVPSLGANIPAEEGTAFASGTDLEKLDLDEQLRSLIAAVAAQEGNGDGPHISVSIFAAFEFTPEGTVVGTVRASDPGGGSLTYRLLADGNTDTDDDGQLPFRIDSGTGAIIVNDSGDLDLTILPRELFVLVVEVRDGDGAAASAAQIIDIVPSPPSLSVDSASAEEGGDLVFTVSLDNAVDAPFDVTVNFANDTTSGSDYDGASRTLSFAGTAGESLQVTVGTTDDSMVELNESFRVSINASDPLILDSDTGSGTIIDNDTATITIEDASAIEGGSLSFVVTLDNPVYAPFDVNVSFADVTATGSAAPLASPADYDNGSRIIHFAGSGGETQSFSVGTLADIEQEGSEEFTVHLSADNPMVDASDSAAGTIGNNGPPIIADLVLTIPENQDVDAVIGSLSASDPEGQPLVFSLRSNANPNGNQFKAVKLGTNNGSITVQDPNDFNFELSNSFSLNVRVSEADKRLSSDATVQITLTDVNEAPRILPINDVVTGSTSASVLIEGDDPDNGQSFDSSVLEIVSFVTDGLTPLQQQVFDARLVVDSDSLYFNEFGGQEKWLRSALTGDWFFILPNSRIFEWDNTPGTLTGRLLGQLDPSVYDDPTLIVVEALAGPLSNPQNVPIPDGSATVALAGNVVTVDSRDFFGIAEITVRATDLNGTGLSAEETFSVEFARLNQAPVLDPIADQVSPGGAQQIVVPLSAADPDGDSPLFFDARLLGPIPASATVEDGVLTITRRGRFFGAFTVEVGVRDRHGARTVQTFEARFVPPTAGRGVAPRGAADVATENGRPNSTVDAVREELFGSADDAFADQLRGSVVENVEVESVSLDESLDSLADRIESLLGELFSDDSPL